MKKTTILILCFWILYYISSIFHKKITLNYAQWTVNKTFFFIQEQKNQEITSGNRHIYWCGFLISLSTAVHPLAIVFLEMSLAHNSKQWSTHVAFHTCQAILMLCILLEAETSKDLWSQRGIYVCMIDVSVKIHAPYTKFLSAIFWYNVPICPESYRAQLRQQSLNI